MPIEIKELVVRFNVEDESRKNVGANKDSELSKSQVKKIIDECIERVLSKVERDFDR